MSNTLTPLIQTILARGLMVLRETCLMPRLVNLGYSPNPKQKGQTVEVPYSVAMAAYNVSPSNTLKPPTERIMYKRQITVDKWKGADFYLTDQERTQIMKENDFLPLQTQEALRALSNQINTDVLDLYKKVYGFVGTPGTTPFSSTTDRTAAKDATLLSTKLTDQLCPAWNRSAVINTDAEAEALALPQFANFDKSGDRDVLALATLGKKYNFDWFTETAIPKHTAGTCKSLTGTLAVSAESLDAETITTITSDNSADDGKTIEPGDIITISGDSQTYAVTGSSTYTLSGTSGSQTISNLGITPGLKVATTGSETLTVKGDHAVNLGFHPEAFALAIAPFEDDVVDKEITHMEYLRDLKTNLILRLEISRQYKQTIWEFDVLYGCELVRPEFAVRLAG